MSALEEDLINLERFEVQNKICPDISKSWKYYKIMNLDNGIKNMAKISDKKINDIDNEALLVLSREIFVVSKLSYP